MSLFKGIPGFAMEQFYDSGSIELRKKLRQAQQSEAVIIQSLGGLLHPNIRLLFTWCTQSTAALNHLRANEDEDTIAGYNEMKRDREGDFLQHHHAKLVWGINEFKDALNDSQTFDNLKNLAVEIERSLSSCNNDTNATTIKKLLSSVDNNSTQNDHYVPPKKDDFSKACMQLFLDECKSIIDDGSSSKSLIVVEREFFNSFDDNFIKKNLEYVCDRLYKVKRENTEIYVYLIGSYHIICGAHHHTQVNSINGIISLMADLRLLYKLHLITRRPRIAIFLLFWARFYLFSPRIAIFFALL
jgi:hypothetical protein